VSGREREREREDAHLTEIVEAVSLEMHSPRVLVPVREFFIDNQLKLSTAQAWGPF